MIFFIFVFRSAALAALKFLNVPYPDDETSKVSAAAMSGNPKSHLNELLMVRSFVLMQHFFRFANMLFQ